MPPGTRDTVKIVGDGTAKMHGADSDTHSRSASPALAPPPPSRPLPTTTTRSDGFPPRRSPDSTKGFDTRHIKRCYPDFATSQAGPSRACMSPTWTARDLQTTDVKNPTIPSPGQEKHKSRSHMASSGSEPSPRDPEKVSVGHKSPRSHRSILSDSQHTTTISVNYDDVEEEEEDEEEDPNQHVLWVLTYLSVLAPLLSLVTCLYALIATSLILVFSPLCLCVTSNLTKSNFQRFLAPPLNLQLGFIYSDFDDEAISKNSKISMLVLVNLLAPIYSIFIALAAWVAAGFWFFAAILGDPNLKHKNEGAKDDDGKATVMRVRRMWETWLIRGLR